MYFDEKVAQEMIERENNIEHVFVSKIFEAALITEFKNKNNLKVVDLGAGAHPKRYIKFLEFLKRNNGKIYWVDQSPYMLDCASKNIPQNFSSIFEFIEEDMVDFLKKKKEVFDAIVFKYSFNYLIFKTLKEWMKIIYKSLSKKGKVIANLHFYEEGMKERSYNAIYKIEEKKVRSGYKPKDNEIIKVCFFKKPGDKSLNPEVFASTKIIYYSPKIIKKFAEDAGFSSVKIFKSWEENDAWKNTFKKLNQNMESRPKAFLFLEK